MFAHRADYGLEDGVWYIMGALPPEASSVACFSLSARMGIEWAALDELLAASDLDSGSKGPSFTKWIEKSTGVRVPVFKSRGWPAGSHRVTCAAALLAALGDRALCPQALWPRAPASPPARRPLLRTPHPEWHTPPQTQKSPPSRAPSWGGRGRGG